MLLSSLFFIFQAMAFPIQNYHCTTIVNANLDFPKPIRLTVEAFPGGRIIGNEGHGNITIGTVTKIEDLQKGTMTFQLMLNLFGDASLSGIQDPSRVTHILQYKDRPMDKESSQVLRYFAGSDQVGGTFVLRGEAIACLP